MVQWNGTRYLSNATNQISHNYHFCDWTTFKPIKLTIYFVLVFLSLSGCFLVVASFFRNKALRKSVHYFITNMAVSDLIIPLVVLPWQITETFYDGTWLIDGVLGSTLCKLLHVAWNVNFNVSILSMAAIAIDRFRFVFFPMKPGTSNSRKMCFVTIGLTWFLSLMFYAHLFYWFRLVRLDTQLVCKPDWESEEMKVLKITWISYMCLSSLIAIVLVGLYSSIIYYLHRQINDLDLKSKLTRNSAKANGRVANVMVAVIIVFYLLWITDSTLYAVEIFFIHVEIPCFLSWFGHVPLQMIYPIINPIIYYMFDKKYQQTFRNLLRYPRICNRQSMSTTTL